MTYDETAKIFTVLKVNYNNFFKSLSRMEAEAMLNLWTEMFADEPYELVGAAIKTYIATDTTGYPPNVGKIKEHVRNLMQPNIMTEQEAVNLIFKACSNSAYNSQAEFDKLPPILQRLVGSPARLKEWALMDSDVLHSVVASNLMRSYKAIVEKEKQNQALPSDIKKLIAETAQKMSLDKNISSDDLLLP